MNEIEYYEEATPMTARSWEALRDRLLQDPRRFVLCGGVGMGGKEHVRSQLEAEARARGMTVLRMKAGDVEALKGARIDLLGGVDPETTPVAEILIRRSNGG